MAVEALHEWERVNATLLETARSEGVEDGSQVRGRHTVTETDITVADRQQATVRNARAAGPRAAKFHDHRPDRN